MSSRRRHPFAVTRHGRSIDSVPIRDAKNPNISYSIKFLEYEACVACGLSLWDWVNRKYPRQFMASIVAYHQLAQAVEAHKQDATRPK